MVTFLYSIRNIPPLWQHICYW